MSNKTLNLIYVGGAGASIHTDLTESILDTLEDVVNVKAYALTSSTGENELDINSLDHHHEFVGDDIYTKALAGSGGDRRKNFELYMKGVETFLNDTHNPFKDAINDNAINIIIHSGSKGTGSTAGPLLADKFLLLNIPFVSIVVVDGSDEVTTKNNMSTLLTYDGISKQRDKSVTISVFRNHDNGNSEKFVNQLIFKHIIQMAILGSNKVDGLDTADYNSLIDVDRNTTLNDIPVGVYALLTSLVDEFGKVKGFKKGYTPILARTVTKNVLAGNIKIKAKHCPTGYFDNEGLGQFVPIAMANCSGVENDIKYLKKCLDDGKIEVKQQDLTSIAGDFNKAPKQEKPIKEIKSITEEDGFSTGFVF